jgi:hypothetical protein
MGIDVSGKLALVIAIDLATTPQSIIRFIDELAVDI